MAIYLTDPIKNYKQYFLRNLKNQQYSKTYSKTTYSFNLIHQRNLQTLKVALIKAYSTKN